MRPKYVTIPMSRSQDTSEKLDFRTKIQEQEEEILWKVTNPLTDEIKLVEAPMPVTLIFRPNNNA